MQKMGKLFGTKLKVLRELKGLNQGDLAKQFGINQATISKWEKGKQEPSFEMLSQIASFFELDEGFFFSDDKKLLHSSYMRSLKETEIEKFSPFHKGWFDINELFYIDAVGTSKSGNEFTIKCYSVSLIHTLNELEGKTIISSNDKYNIINVILNCVANPNAREWQNGRLNLELGYLE